MEEGHKYVFGAESVYSDNYERIFRKRGKREVDKKGNQASRRVQGKGKKGAHGNGVLRNKSPKKGLKGVNKNQKTSGSG